MNGRVWNSHFLPFPREKPQLKHEEMGGGATYFTVLGHVSCFWHIHRIIMSFSQPFKGKNRYCSMIMEITTASPWKTRTMSSTNWLLSGGKLCWSAGEGLDSGLVAPWRPTRLDKTKCLNTS